MAKIVINFVLIQCIFVNISFGEQVLKSEEITNIGDWGNFSMCPNQTSSHGKLMFVKAFQIKSAKWIGPGYDDTCMNGLRFFCGDLLDNLLITSSVGSYGKWRNIYTCGDGYIVGFQLRVEKHAVDGDDTATNNIRIFCSNNRNTGEYIEADGEYLGNWSAERRCGMNEAVCGLQTQVQPDGGILVDNTALNNIAVRCCDLPREEKSKQYATKSKQTDIVKKRPVSFLSV